MEENIAVNILEKVHQVTGISGKWKPARVKKDVGIDGYVQLTIQNRSVRFPVEVKRNIHKYAYPALLQQKKSNAGFIVMAKNIQPAMKQTLKKAGINYMDGAGNAFVQAGEYFIYVDGLKNEALPKAMKTKPFGKAGLKVVFALFTHGAM